MNRHLAPILLGLLLAAGCTSQGQAPTSDPFLVGRTRIPPPGTGAAGQPADPYYSPPASSPTAWQPSGAAAPTGASAATPGGETRLGRWLCLKTNGLAEAPALPVSSPPISSPPAPSTPASSTPASSSPSAPPSPAASVPPSSPGSGIAVRGVSLQGSRVAAAAPNLDRRQARASIRPAPRWITASPDRWMMAAPAGT